jgi:hypothetical protein
VAQEKKKKKKIEKKNMNVRKSKNFEKYDREEKMNF